MVKPATNYKGATDEGLADLIQQWEKDRSRHMDMLNAIEADLANFRTELRHRKLAAFWQANEGLRLEVGDSVMITQEAVEKFGGSNGSIGRVLRITELNLKNGIVVSVGFGVKASVPLDIARRMRFAYLQAHGEAQP